MLREQVFSDINRYSNGIDPEWAAQIAEHKEKVGFIDYDAPNAPKRKIPRTDAQMRELEGIERKKAEAKAQAEHNAALARLADGTAIHRQERDRTPLLSEKGTSKSRVAKKKVALGKHNSEYKVAKARRAVLLTALKAGEFVKIIRQQKGEDRTQEYHQQYGDVASIRHKLGLNIARVYCNQTGQSFYVINNFVRYQMPRAISGMSDDKKELLTALLSKQFVLASDMTGATKAVSKTVLRLMREHDLDIYTVFNKSKTEGWIFIFNEEKRKAKIQELGDMLQGLDILRERKAEAS